MVTGATEGHHISQGMLPTGIHYDMDWFNTSLSVVLVVDSYRYHIIPVRHNLITLSARFSPPNKLLTIVERSIVHCGSLWV